MRSRTSAGVVSLWALGFGAVSAEAVEDRPEAVRGGRLDDDLVAALPWRDAVTSIAGVEVQVVDERGSVRIDEGGRRAASTRKLPAVLKLKRKIQGRSSSYWVALRRGPAATVELASLTGVSVKSKVGTTWIIDADLDATFCEAEGDFVLLHDSVHPVPFAGEVWHRDQAWELDEEGALVEVERVAGLRVWNHARQLLGHASVALDPERSRGAALHATYVAHNWHLVFNHHSEDRANAWYTEEGARAAGHSLFGYPSPGHPKPFAHSVVGNLDIVYHRRAILDPRLAAVGLGMQDAKAPLAGRYQVVCLDTGGLTGRGSGPFAWPPPGHTEAPTRFNGLELPMPLPADVSAHGHGYPVTVLFGDVNGIREPSLELRRVGRGTSAPLKGFCYGPGNEIPGDGSTYAYAYRNNSGLCHFIAADPLAREQWYEATCRWEQRGQPHELCWRFRTGKTLDTPID